MCGSPPPPALIALGRDGNTGLQAAAFSLNFINSHTEGSSWEKHGPACNQSCREDTDSPQNCRFVKGLGLSPNQKCLHYKTDLGQGGDNPRETEGAQTGPQEEP